MPTTWSRSKKSGQQPDAVRGPIYFNLFEFSPFVFFLVPFPTNKVVSTRELLGLPMLQRFLRLSASEWGGKSGAAAWCFVVCFVADAATRVLLGSVASK